MSIINESILTAAEACRHRALRNRDGSPAGRGKFYRLCDKGVTAADGSIVALEFAQLPSGRVTSAEAISRFVEALSRRPTASARQPPRSIRPSLMKATTAATLAAAGLIDAEGAGGRDG